MDIRQAWTLEALADAGASGETLDSFFGNKDENFWLDITTPSAEDLQRIASIFGIHPLSIEDMQMQDSREKCEIFERYLFLCLRTCDQKLPSATDQGRRASLEGCMERRTSPCMIYILVFQELVISVHHEPLGHIRRVLKRLYSLRSNHLKFTGDWVMYSLLDDAVDEFNPEMATLQFEVDTIDDLVLFLTHNEQSDMLRRIGRARKCVVHLLRLLKPKLDILKVLTKRTSEYLQEHTLIYLRDVNDHVLTNIQNLDSYSETLNRSHSNYLAQISIELNEASNRMNVVMKKLTAAAALVLPLSLISGIWGMNVPVPGQVGVSGLYPLIPFLIIVMFMACIMGGMYYIGHRNDWW